MMTNDDKRRQPMTTNGEDKWRHTVMTDDDKRRQGRRGTASFTITAS